MDRAASAKVQLTAQLLEQGLLIASGVPGLYGRGVVMNELIARIERSLDALSRAETAEHLSFPPLIPRELLRRVGYMENFPQLCGSVHSFFGNEREHAQLVQRVNDKDDWGVHLRQTEVVLLPAACYPLYPTLSGALPEGGRRFDFTGHCFRHEPSDDPARMQYFQVREKVCAGTPEDVQRWRASWLERGLEWLRSLSLPVSSDVASDPFFGRGGRMMKQSQESLALKHELLVPITSEENPTAVASFNYHQEHFGSVFEIRTAAGETAHTSCVGFGIDRIAVALLKHHGLDPARWPAEVRGRLWT